MNEYHVESTEELKDKIEHTRDSLVQKIQTLESDITETFTGAKNSVQETINDVKSAFTIKNIYSKYPIMFLATSAYVTYSAIRLLKKKSTSDVDINSSFIHQSFPLPDKHNNFTRVLKTETGQEIKRLSRNAMIMAIDSINSVLKKKIPNLFHKSLDNISQNVKNNFIK